MTQLPDIADKAPLASDLVYFVSDPDGAAEADGAVTLAEIVALGVRVVSMALATPPGGPAPGSIYVPAATATGAWAGQENKLAIWMSGAGVWRFAAPTAGMTLLNLADGGTYRWTGSAWGIVSGASEFATKAALAAANVPAGVSTARTTGHGAAGDGGGATYRRVGSQPAHNLKVQSADGAWWELVPDPGGYIDVRQAGAVGDDATNDAQAFVDALSFASLNATANDNATFGVAVPPGNFYLGATTLQLKASVHLRGQGSGMSGAKPTELRWDAQVTGIIVHRHNTTGVTTEADPNALSADGSRIEGLRLESGGGTIAGVTDALKGHGVWLRARATLCDLTVNGFPGNGVHIVATAGGAADLEGNANNWVIDRARITSCHQSGVFVDGADVNVGLGLKVDASSNGRWGIWDSSFLGCTWLACHAASNGVATVAGNPSGASSFVHYNGPENGNTDLRYAAAAGASEAALAATVPGTNEAVWIEIGAGASHPVIPTWTSAQPAGTFFVGGAYHSDNANARSLFAGCYTESGQAPAQLTAPANVVGGLIDGYKGTATGLVGAKLKGAVSIENHDRFATARDLTLEINSQAERVMKFLAGGDHGSGLTVVGWDEAKGHVLIGEHADSGGRRPIRITTDLNTNAFGRAAALTGGQLLLFKGVFIGSSENRVKYFAFDSKPASGDWARGDLVLNYNPLVKGDPAGWRLTTAGTIGAGAVLEEFFVMPDLPAARGKMIRPHASATRVEWRDAPKAGTATIADTAATVAVSFTAAFGSANYAVALAADGNELVWVTSKTASGFTLNRAATAGARAVDWTATPHENV